MHFLAEYGLFLAKTITIVFAILIVLLTAVVLGSKGKARAKERFEIKKLNDKYHDLTQALKQEILNKNELKAYLKEEKNIAKKREKDKEKRKRIFVVHFQGDMRASGVNQLRQEITAILLVATPKDEVLVTVDSPGGLVNSYGLAASQLKRIREHNIPLTVAIDKVAASGGYLMAAVANKIIAAPFAIVGSIGVIAQIPNFHRLLKKNDVDFEQIMAGEYKRTLTMFGQNTDEARKKFQEEVNEIHQLFKQFIVENRPIVNINEVATGEHWCASQALSMRLVDKLITSDDYLLNASKDADIYKIKFCTKKSFSEKFSLTAQASFDRLLETWRQQDQQSKLF